MAKSWNPAAPAVLGPQVFATSGADSMLQAHVVRDLTMPSTQAETVTGFGLPIRDVGALPAGQIAPSTLIEVFANGQQHLNPPFTRTIYRPTADLTALSDIGGLNWVGQPGSFATNLWSAIDRPVQWPMVDPTTEFISWQNGAAPGANRYVFEVGSAAFPLTQRVLQLTVNAVIGSFTASGPYVARQFALRLVRRSDGVTHTPVGGTGIFGAGWTTPVNIVLGEINPWEDRPWTPADVRSFGAGGNYGIRWEAVGDTATSAVIYACELHVLHMTENRLAVGMWRRPGSQASGVVTTTSLITLPGGAANWAKGGSPNVYVYRWRIPGDFFRPNPTQSTVHWRTMAQQVFTPDDQMPHGETAALAQLNGNGLSVATTPAAARPAINLTVAGSPSSDSQPYWVDPDLTGRSLPATTTLAAEQRFTPGATQNYLGYRFLICPTTNGPDTDAVRFSVRRVSDNAIMGTPVVLTAGQVRAMTRAASGVEWYVVAGQMDSAAALVSGTQYALRWEVVAGTNSWFLPLMRTSTSGNPSFGGTANSAAVFIQPSGPGLPDAANEVPGVLLQQPPPVTAATADIAVTPTRLGHTCFCEVDGIENVVVKWIAGAVPSYSFTQVQRILDTGSGADAWVDVAYVTSVLTVVEWTDHEVPRGTAAMYRIRNIDTNQSFSEWATTGWVRPHARGAEVILTSNENPDMTVVYNHEPAVGYDLLDFDGDTLVPIEGADYQMAFVGTERRGTATTLRVIANFGRQPCDDLGNPIGKARIFAPLVHAARAPGLPYVCVLDSDGNRTFAHIDVRRATSVEPGWRYHADMTVTPITDVPMPVAVTQVAV